MAMDPRIMAMQQQAAMGQQDPRMAQMMAARQQAAMGQQRPMGNPYAQQAMGGGQPPAATMQQHEAELARRAQMGQGGGMDPRAQQMMAHQQQLAQMGGMGPKGPGFTGGFQPGPNGPQMGGRMGMFGQQAMGGARPQVPWMSQGPGGMKPQMRPMGGGMAGPMAGPRRMY